MEALMTTPHTYITTTIPYVNARPHLGFALELVQADVLARHRRARGDRVRLQAGTDDNSLKNVLAARAARVGVQEFVDANADAFVALAGPLSLSVDDVIRTSRDPRHRPGVERLWQACADAGDLYRRHYEGLYCVGCEQFYTPEELAGGRCPEHGTEPQPVSEENWFFRLSRYGDALRDLITSGALRIEPAERRNEVLAQLAAGLDDFSVSRSTERAHGWGIPVPGDPSQVVYVWFDALVNYVSALGYGTGGGDLQRWWTGAGRRIHLAGKGVLRFHAVYWPAILLSAGLPLPTDILVHDYLTADGQKISKSGGATVDPAVLAAQYGTDAVRWWLLREVPRVGDTDFTVARLVSRANDELANGLGNLVSRVTALIRRYRDGQVPEAGARATGVPAAGAPAAGAEPLEEAIRLSAGRVDAALAGFDFRAAPAAVWSIVDEANRYVSQAQPWVAGKLERAGDQEAGRQLDAILATLIRACRAVAGQLEPFLPDAAARVAQQCAALDGKLPAAAPVFSRLDAAAPAVPSQPLADGGGPASWRGAAALGSGGGVAGDDGLAAQPGPGRGRVRPPDGGLHDGREVGALGQQVQDGGDVRAGVGAPGHEPDPGGVHPPQRQPEDAVAEEDAGAGAYAAGPGGPQGGDERLRAGRGVHRHRVGRP
jgi:methionyl-tRNA synthetase